MNREEYLEAIEEQSQYWADYRSYQQSLPRPMSYTEQNRLGNEWENTPDRVAQKERFLAAHAWRKHQSQDLVPIENGDYILYAAADRSGFIRLARVSDRDKFQIIPIVPQFSKKVLYLRQFNHVIKCSQVQAEMIVEANEQEK